MILAMEALDENYVDENGQVVMQIMVVQTVHSRLTAHRTLIIHRQQTVHRTPIIRRQL